MSALYSETENLTQVKMMPYYICKNHYCKHAYESIQLLVLPKTYRVSKKPQKLLKSPIVNI